MLGVHLYFCGKYRSQFFSREVVFRKLMSSVLRKSKIWLDYQITQLLQWLMHHTVLYFAIAVAWCVIAVLTLYTSHGSNFNLFQFHFAFVANDRQPVKSMVIGRPVLLALEDIDGTPSFLEKALRFVEEHGKLLLLCQITMGWPLL